MPRRSTSKNAVGGSKVILRKTQSLIVDDLKPEPETKDSAKEQEPDDDGDICTPKSDPSTDDDRPLE